MSWWVFVCACLCGGLGALCRFGLDSLITKHARFVIPIGTMCVNILACFLAGLLTGLFARAIPDTVAAHAVKYMIGTGFLGGFSTFSTASVEGFRQFEIGGESGARRGAIHVGLMLALSVGFCFLGLWLGSL